MPIVTYAFMALLAVVFILDYLILVPKGTKRWNARYLIFGKHAEPGEKFELISKGRTTFNQALCMKGSAVRRGQLWRMVTSALLHGGLAHLAGNLITLYVVGGFLEPRLELWAYILVLVCGPIFSNIGNLRVLGNEFGFGASSSTFAMIGVVVAIMLREPGLFASFSLALKLVLVINGLFNIITDKWGLTEHLFSFAGGILLAFAII